MGLREGGTSQAGRMVLGCLSVTGFLLALASTQTGTAGHDPTVASAPAVSHAPLAPPPPPASRRAVSVAVPLEPEPEVLAMALEAPAPEPAPPQSEPVAAERPAAPPVAAPAPPAHDMVVAAAPVPAGSPSLLGDGTLGIASAPAAPLPVSLPVVGDVLAPVVTPIVNVLPLHLGL